MKNKRQCFHVTFHGLVSVRDFAVSKGYMYCMSVLLSKRWDCIWFTIFLFPLPPLSKTHIPLSDQQKEVSLNYTKHLFAPSKIHIVVNGQQEKCFLFTTNRKQILILSSKVLFVLNDQPKK